MWAKSGSMRRVWAAGNTPDTRIKSSIGPLNKAPLVPKIENMTGLFGHPQTAAQAMVRRAAVTVKASIKAEK
jgi:hypothetical protein